MHTCVYMHVMTEYGMERCVSLSDMTSDEVLKTLELLVSKGEQKEKAVS